MCRCMDNLDILSVNETIWCYNIFEIDHTVVQGALTPFTMSF